VKGGSEIFLSDFEKHMQPLKTLWFTFVVAKLTTS